ncbi:unnamed protein product [Owenia fusiformis]|uniref:Uncharacterized protein n=1 Tax=Owenia fusiformis TaxID=6347 RepID=A0A8J1XG29_OWEFU|nr:unnamed protein product [Owenia fusiformis]
MDSSVSISVKSSSIEFIGNSSGIDVKTELSGLEASHCDHGALLGPLGLFVQGLLAFLAFTSLIVKRFLEPKPERRPWRIWFYDTSKQAVGAAVIHFANVFLAGVFTGDPCTWYFVSFLLDSTIGLVVIYILLKLTQVVVRRKHWDTLKFGEYGKPPACNAWIGQSALYILVIIVEKIIMTLLVLPSFWEEVRKFIMSPIKSPKLELVIVMFIVPLIINAFMFWVVDNFLMRKSWKSQSMTTLVTADSSGVKYFKAVDKVKYYSKSEKADESESDILLSVDEDQDTRHRTNGKTGSDSETAFFGNEVT